MNRQFAKTAYRSYLVFGIFSSMSVAACTFIDALLIGNFIGSDGLAVAGIMTPVFLMFSLLGVTVAMGANVSISRSLGAGDTGEARRLMGVQLLAGITLSGILLPGLLVFQRPILTFLGASGSLYPYGAAYLLPVFLASPLFVLYPILAYSVRADGNSRLSAAASGVVIVTNLVLDLVLMGVFRIGIAGASISLCIAQLLGTVLLTAHFGRKNAALRLCLAVPRREDLVQILKNGFGTGSAFIFQAVIMLAFNRLLLRDPALGVLNTAAFSVFYTISTVPGAFFDAAGGAFAPVVPFFSGERDCGSILAVRRLGLGFTLGVIAAVLSVCLVFARALVIFFGIDPGYAGTVADVFRLYALSFAFSGINMVMTAFWQTIVRASLAAAMSTLRNFLVILAAGVALIGKFGIWGLAAAYVLTEGICLALVLGIWLLSPSRKFVQEKYKPEGRVFEKNYIIKTENISHVASDLEELCENWEIGMKQSFFMNFIAEEIILNLMKFAIGESDREHYIDIKILEDPQGYVFRIRDDVKTYDPFASNGDEVDNAVLTVIRKKTKYCEYSRKLVFNYLYMII